MMKWSPSLRVSITRNERRKYEMVEDPEAKPRLLCYYNEQDWKKVILPFYSIPNSLSENDGVFPPDKYFYMLGCMSSIGIQYQN